MASAVLTVPRSLGENERVDVSPLTHMTHCTSLSCSVVIGGSDKVETAGSSLIQPVEFSEFRSSGDESHAKRGPCKCRSVTGVN